MLTLPKPSLILASTSPYRNELLSRLKLRFEAISPQVDESVLSHETPIDLAQRLGLAKAQAVANLYPQAIVIGSDQVADLNGLCLGKPLTHPKAVAQLQAMQGHTLIFHTSVAVIHLEKKLQLLDVASVRVKFRQLSDAEIENYLLIEKPYDCAGSAKSEGLGITLLDSIESDDPTSLIGLPLIRTSQMLRIAGLDILSGGL